MKFHKLFLSVALVITSGPAIRAEIPSALAILDARVLTVSGPVLEHGTVLLRNGLIEDVGERVVIPPRMLG